VFDHVHVGMGVLTTLHCVLGTTVSVGMGSVRNRGQSVIFANLRKRLQLEPLASCCLPALMLLAHILLVNHELADLVQLARAKANLAPSPMPSDRGTFVS